METYFPEADIRGKVTLFRYGRRCDVRAIFFGNRQDQADNHDSKAAAGKEPLAEPVDERITDVVVDPSTLQTTAWLALWTETEPWA